MSYLVLARKYRPKTFDEVVGQDHIVDALKNAIASNKVAHAFLFSGPRGVGKTTCARILAKEINKTKPCEAGLLEFDGGDLDVIEIDGASNRGIDEARAIRDNVMFMSMSGGYKFYIIDEVHMLTEPAFNALLKTLEEPPEHVKFIFATTDPEKVPTTIRSRCQHFNFKRLSMDVIKAQLKSICAAEKLSVDDEALFAIARAAQGGMRDALGILDQLAAGTDKVNVDDANALLGLIDVKYIFDLAGALIRKDTAAAMTGIETVIAAGKDDARLLKDMVEHFRHLMMMRIDPEKLQPLIDYPVYYRKQLLEQANSLSLGDILKVMDILIGAKDTERLTDAPRLALELALARSAVVLGHGDTPVPPMPSRPAPAAKPLTPPLQRPLPSASAAPSGNVKREPGPAAPAAAVSAATAVLAKALSMEEVCSQWHDMTSSVQESRTYLGACLLEGKPVSVKGQALTIAFPESCAYQKECLEETEAGRIVAEAFSKILGRDIAVTFVIEKGVARDPSGALQSALEEFDGEVVNEWHNEGK